MISHSVGNQAEVEQSDTGTSSSNNKREDHHTEESTQQVPQSATSETSQRVTRYKWSRGEYKDVIEAYFRALADPKILTNIDTCNIWRDMHLSLRHNIDKDCGV